MPSDDPIHLYRRTEGAILGAGIAGSAWLFFQGEYLLVPVPFALSGLLAFLVSELYYRNHQRGSA